MEPRPDLLLCRPAWVPYVAEEGVKDGTCLSCGIPVLSEFFAHKNVIILCDSWYVKQKLVSVVDGYENLNLIGNARTDSVIYDLKIQPTGRKGRPPSIDRPSTGKENGTRRLFFSTIFPTQLQIFCT